MPLGSGEARDGVGSRVKIVKDTDEGIHGTISSTKRPHIPEFSTMSTEYCLTALRCIAVYFKRLS